jgi:DNA-binding LytR/AlgR family response regulator
MILYRFSDAVRELDESLGQQVHRSYWVNTGAIESMHAKAKDFQIRMSNSTDIPVSTPYQGMIRELARSARIPLRG